MATPDYDQFAEDHQCLLIVIKQIGPQMNASLFNRIYDRLSQLYEFKITDNKGMGFERTVRLRYKQSYSIENNAWGEFQAHRRLVGLITIARSFNDNEIESICELHNTIRDTYANTLFDSRCFVIGNLSTTTTEKVVFFESEELCCEQIEARVQELITGLFWVLESKRLDRASEKMDKIPLLMAPFEEKALFGLDNDTFAFRRKCMGRMRKHIADLSLLAGLPQESITNYISAIEQLKAVGDKLWLASAYEGLCAASLALLFPDRWHQIHLLRRQFHFEKSLFHDLISRCDYEVSRSEVCEAMRRIAANSEGVILNGEDSSSKAGANKNILTVDQFYDRYKEAASYYALYRGASILEFECSFKAARTLIFFERYLKASDFIQNAVFITFTQTTDEQIERLLQISQLYENIRFYRKAAFYKRFAALKSVSLHVKSPNWERCYFLMLPALHGYGVTLDPTEYDQRLARNDVHWSGIHVQLVQEMITTAVKMENQTLAMRHLSFMLQCLFNHISPSQRQDFATKLSSLASKCGEGSPVILKLSNSAIIPSVNFTKFPTVIFFKVEPLAPYLRPVKLKLISSAETERLKELAQNSGPFIYTPLQLNRLFKQPPPKVTRDSVSKVAFYWAEGNTGKVTISLHNYLPIELNISSIMVMTDGVAFEPNHDTSLKISPLTSFTNIAMTGIPRASGTLDILGYKIHSLGIKSDCQLSQLPNARKLKLPARFAVEVVPRLPLMCAQCLADDLTAELRSSKAISPTEDVFTDMHISNSTFIELYTGQCKTYQMKLSNISRNVDEQIDFVEVCVIFPKNINPELQKLVTVEWDNEQLNNTLPIGRELNTTFDITISVKGNFVCHLKQSQLVANNMEVNRNNKLTASNMSLAQKKSQVLGSTKLANFINELQTKKFNSELNNASNNVLEVDNETEFPDEIFKTSIVEFCLQFDYSGGPGLNSGFCRQTSVHFVLEVSPSVLLTHWDVLSAEQPDECYMVFDALNATEHELTLLYAQNKEMLIESREKCRIPVPIKRCPLNCLSALGDDDEPLSLPFYGGNASTQCQNTTTSNNNNFNNLNHNKQASPAKAPSTDFLSYIFPTEQKLKAILARIRLHISSQINLQWHLAMSPDLPLSEGLVSVDQVPYTNEMLKALLIPPISSEIQINELRLRSSHGEIAIKVAEQATIRTRLHNTSETSLQQLRQYLFCYQDYQTAATTTTSSTMTKGAQSHSSHYHGGMNSKVVISGSDSICIDQLPSSETHEHECGLVFLYAGVYKLQICCLPEESFQKQKSSFETRNWIEASSAQSLFTCLHTIEITVEE